MFKNISLLAWHSISEAGDLAATIALHPSDTGMQAIAKRIMTAIK